MKKKLAKLVPVLLGATLCTLNLAAYSQAVWAAAPINGRIVFSSDRTGAGDLYSMHADGSDLVQLTTDAARDANVDYSSDGTKLAFTNQSAGNLEIYTADANGSSQTQITNNPGDTNTKPTFSPDDSMIAYEAQHGSNREIYTMNIDGTSQVNITNATGSDFDPGWSPDGSQIVFTSTRTTNRQIYVMNADGSNQTRITNNAFTDLYPRFSPDGDKIAFSSNRSGNYEIYVMNADGSNVIQLTTDSASDQTPEWSPDGTKIVFRSNRTGNYDIFTMNADGSDQTNITNNAALDENPTWQPLTISPTTINSAVVLDAKTGSVTYDTLANHNDVYDGLDPGSVEVTTLPSAGSVTVDPITGIITYSPDQHASSGSSFITRFASFFFPKASAQSVAQDSFTYQVCSYSSSQLCTSNSITVLLATATTGVSDDGTDVNNVEGLAPTGQNHANFIIISAVLGVTGLVVIGYTKTRAKL